jgi:hypothetical protein
MSEYHLALEEGQRSRFDELRTVTAVPFKSC